MAGAPVSRVRVDGSAGEPYGMGLGRKGSAKNAQGPPRGRCVRAAEVQLLLRGVQNGVWRASPHSLHGFMVHTPTPP